jgi:hypothetical protein
MDPLDALKSEVFRPLVTLIIPGATAILPFVAVVHFYNPEFRTFADTYPGLYLTIVAFAVIGAGFVLENLGSRIESGVWDNLIERDTRTQFDDWFSFLCYAPEHEAVGHRYLRTLTIRLKFELSFSLALIALWFGLLWLDAIEVLWDRQSVLRFSLIILAFAAYLLWESEATARSLAVVRHLLIRQKELAFDMRKPEPPTYARPFDISLLVAATVCAPWAAFLLWMAFKGQDVFERIPAAMGGIMFALFAYVLLQSWRWFARGGESAGRRRGVAVRYLLAFAGLLLYTIAREHYAHFEPNGGSEVIAGLAIVVFAGFSSTKLLRGEERKFARRPFS